ncbi:MAG: peptidoglycan DD-metalloendopeptidase family protein, partial [Chloroflexota bacterium]
NPKPRPKMRMTVARVWALLFACTLFITPHLPAAAQDAPCGVVDALDYPIDIADTLELRYNDFGLLRPRFGGRHTGIDVAFNRRGDPVRAAARGRVTYADPNGWDTEKGVVVIQHTFPDGSIIHTVYGHMEQSDDIRFPVVGTCVERGDIVGVVGWPSRGLPHLHYEIRTFLPGGGGPGYVVDNPLERGWLDPLDFTDLWRIRLAPGYVSSVTFTDVPTLPPVIADDGSSILATGSAIEAFSAQGSRLWRVTTDGVVTGILGLPGNRVVAHTRNGQVLTLQGGRYAAVWQVSGPDAPLVALGETLVIVTEGGGLSAFDPMGVALWSLPGAASIIAVSDFQTNGVQVSLAVRTAEGVRWRVVDAAGQVAYETTFRRAPLIAPVISGGWFALDGTTLYALSGSERREIASLAPAPGRTARIAADPLGSAYIYLADEASTLISVSASGQIRWRQTYPVAPSTLAPLLRTDNGCLLYALDEDGALHVFNAATGETVSNIQIYAGGIQNGSPTARLLLPQAGNRILVSAGFLSAVVLDGAAISGGAMAQCVLG